MSAFKESVVQIAELCVRQNVLNFIISPGSRSAPLTLALVRHPNLSCRAIVDERCAGFVALGMAQQLERPVGLVCTSGTAVLNYGPSIAEAFYQRIPLLIFTADRPPEWLDQNDGQTIPQREIFGKLCRASFELPLDDPHPDVRWHAGRIISEAILASLSPAAGPVHINVPLREPLYPNSELKYNSPARIIASVPQRQILEDHDWDSLLIDWRAAQRRLIVAGMRAPNAKLAEFLRVLQSERNTAVLFDATANLHDALPLHHSDMILGTENESIRGELWPDLLISFGGPVVSKNLKLFLRKHKPKIHWHLDPAGQCIDTFQSLTHILPVSADYFFERLVNSPAFQRRGAGGGSTDATSGYGEAWIRQEYRVRKDLEHFLKSLPYCEFSAIHAILTRLPKYCHVQLGNSGIIRFVNYLGLSETNGIRVNSNRGTSGIDGTLSTAVGASLATSKLTTAIIGDLAFFYDRNALWNSQVPANLRVIVINNYGGGIFRLLDGAGTLPELGQYFEVEHQLTAERTAADHGLNYSRCASLADLEKQLPKFFAPQDRAAILEVHTDKQVNTETFLQFKSIMR
ncbi:MAG TPA: 2-succinyl-5-enolpyruvyl-6-hydroxy-3-cyclohexene-1-carboxylic-acid synthase [bacterium]